MSGVASPRRGGDDKKPEVPVDLVDRGRDVASIADVDWRLRQSVKRTNAYQLLEQPADLFVERRIQDRMLDERLHAMRLRR